MSEWSQGLTLTQNVDWGSSSVPHFLQVGLLLSPIIYKCLRKVLCPVRGPITTLDCVILKDNNRILAARSGPEISSRACLCVLKGPRHNTRWWVSTHHYNFLLILCLETIKKGSGQNRPLRACLRFHFLALRHAQGPNTAPQCAG